MRHKVNYSGWTKHEWHKGHLINYNVIKTKTNSVSKIIQHQADSQKQYVVVITILVYYIAVYGYSEACKAYITVNKVNSMQFNWASLSVGLLQQLNFPDGDQ